MVFLLVIVQFVLFAQINLKILGVGLDLVVCLCCICISCCFKCNFSELCISNLEIFIVGKMIVESIRSILNWVIKTMKKGRTK